MTTMQDKTEITMSERVSESLKPSDLFEQRHMGHDAREIAAMLEVVGYRSIEELIEATVPGDIRLKDEMELRGLPSTLSEGGVLKHLANIAGKNRVFRSMIGMGYHDCETPAVILRNVLENARWYTPYTPYQAEISQGRLEALLNFQTMVSDLTGMEMANASMLDEATSAAEAMAMCYAIARGKKSAFFVSEKAHPQTIAVMQTRAVSMGIELHVGNVHEIDWANGKGNDLAGILVQYPTTDGRVEDYMAVADAVHAAGGMLVAAADILSLVLLRSPGEFGADIVVGSTQRFGVPMGFGGPHAGYMATSEKYARKMPGRIVGVSIDSEGNKAYRLAIQTREQHIKRDRATSNICTAQVLLAVIAGFYAVYHGPEGLRKIAKRVHGLAVVLTEGLKRSGYDVPNDVYFDNVKVTVGREEVDHILFAAREHGMNLRKLDDQSVCINLDETTTLDEAYTLIRVFARNADVKDIPHADSIAKEVTAQIPEQHTRTTDFLTHDVFNRYHSEHELLRYMSRLLAKDISLANSMIPLGSCTMKLNAAVEMIPITWAEFSQMHPYAPSEQTQGYRELFRTLESWLCAVTGFDVVSLQPNAGSQGEYAGLLAIKRYHAGQGEPQRNICLIPESAHGTNPASSVVAGLKVVGVKCDDHGNINVADLREKAEKHAENLSCLMVTYPSTHGVYETAIREICQITHDHGGQVYMDGANMNAQVGLCNPAAIGADVCHLNLHKTFCIPHGGGGPGMGPIAARAHLGPYMPGNPIQNDAQADYGSIEIWGAMKTSANNNTSNHALDGFTYPVSAALYGSASILPISWMYIALMGADGLKRATEIAILNANYIAKRLTGHYDVLYTGENGTVAHEGIVDCRGFQKSAGISVEDIAKRLIDYGFHAPTMSFPVAGTLMIEPTESESKDELDRFCDAMISIRTEIAEIERGEASQDDNVLVNAPHSATMICHDDWEHDYSRNKAAYPAAWQKQNGAGTSNVWKYWPPVSRIDNAYGDRNLICTCLSVTEAEEN
ncbi:aminomethyl-transferring glycine dehydrogenase [Poriferisphaera sp. WC338]|uniref:aminomethyl-transferring glycine dehydrogenase n=1 Tax=Poriferisphaera sp. WC338 TaxID=3425129 RepID=UPI003D819725